jgi:hypothetical protein
MRLDRPWSLPAGGRPLGTKAVDPAAAVTRPCAVPAEWVAHQRAISGSFPPAPGAGRRRAAFRKRHGGKQPLLLRPARRSSRLVPVAHLMAQAPDPGALSTRGDDTRHGRQRSPRHRPKDTLPPLPAGSRAIPARRESATPMYRRARPPLAPAATGKACRQPRPTEVARAQFFVPHGFRKPSLAAPCPGREEQRPVCPAGRQDRGRIWEGSE